MLWQRVERIGWYRIASSSGAVVALIVANAIPLFGALFLGWNVWVILIVYWLENGSSGSSTSSRSCAPKGRWIRTSTWRMNGKPIERRRSGAIAGFFILHYGIFWFVHGVFVLTMPLFRADGFVLVVEGRRDSSGRHPHPART